MKRCLADLAALDDALGDVLDALDGEGPDSGTVDQIAELFRAFRASFEELGEAPENLPEELRLRMEAVLGKYAVTSSEAQRLRAGLAKELGDVQGARRRLDGAAGKAGNARVGDECDMRG